MVLVVGSIGVGQKYIVGRAESFKIGSGSKRGGACLANLGAQPVIGGLR